MTHDRDEQQAYADPPNTHKFRDYPYTTVYVFEYTSAVHGVTHYFHVPAELVNVIEADFRHGGDMPPDASYIPQGEPGPETPTEALQEFAARYGIPLPDGLHIDVSKPKSKP